nr:hypothetical protein [Tanacetum cinerariifolium]
MMSEIDTDSLTIEQYLMLTEGNHAPGMVKPKFRRTIKWNIEEMTIVEYIDLQRSIFSRDQRSLGSVSKDERGDNSGALPCQLSLKELNPRNFTLPCTIGNLNLYAMANLGASVNVMPKSIFEYLELASLKETIMVVEMADMTKKAPIRNSRKYSVILGRPFLVTIHAQIDVFKREISLGIEEDRVKFNMDEVDTMLFKERTKMECSNNGCVFGTMKDKALGES